MKLIFATAITILLACSLSAQADCPLDHFITGCNRDGSVNRLDFARMAANWRMPAPSR